MLGYNFSFSFKNYESGKNVNPEYPESFEKFPSRNSDPTKVNPLSKVPSLLKC